VHQRLPQNPSEGDPTVTDCDRVCDPILDRIDNRSFVECPSDAHPIRSDEQTLDRAAARDAMAQQARGKHTRVVDDHEVTRAQQVRQRTDAGMRDWIQDRD